MLFSSEKGIKDSALSVVFGIKQQALLVVCFQVLGCVYSTKFSLYGWKNSRKLVKVFNH